MTSVIPILISVFIYLSYSFYNSQYLTGDIRIWWSLIIFALIVDIILINKYHKAIHKKLFDYRKWGRYFNYATMNMAVCVSYFFLLFDIKTIELAYALLFVMYMIVLGSSLVIGLHLKLFLYFNTTIFGIIGIQFWESPYFYEFLLFIPICLLTALGFNKKIAFIFNESINLRFENEELINSLREQKELAEQASFAKTKFLATASHDLRQPLQSITLLLAALSRYISDDKQTQILNKVKSSVSSLSELLDSLLDISKLDAGLIEARSIKFSLLELLNQETDKYRQIALNKGLVIQNEVCLDLELISDPQLVKRIISNLIDNALNYTSQGVIRLSAKDTNNGISISVTDTGIGISELEQQRIFNEFYQIDNHERDRRKGLGLGLAIVKRLSTLLCGKVSLKSTYGKGSCFTIELPNLETVNEHTNDQEIPSYTSSNLNNLCILIVDDEIDVRESMELLLESWGCHTISVACEEDAITKLSSGACPKISAMIVDHRLRDKKTGLECASKVMTYLNKEIPTLIITGDTEGQVIAKIEASGHQFMHKPINEQKLSAFLGSVTDDSSNH